MSRLTSRRALGISLRIAAATAVICGSALIARSFLRQPEPLGVDADRDPRWGVSSRSFEPVDLDPNEVTARLGELTYEQLIPNFEALTYRRRDRNDGGRWHACLCGINPIPRDLRYDGFAHLVLGYFFRDDAELLEPYVEQDTFPRGIFVDPRIRKAIIESAMPEAKTFVDGHLRGLPDAEDAPL